MLATVEGDLDVSFHIAAVVPEPVYHLYIYLAETITMTLLGYVDRHHVRTKDGDLMYKLVKLKKQQQHQCMNKQL
jgi:hypothetical protein